MLYFLAEFTICYGKWMEKNLTMPLPLQIHSTSVTQVYPQDSTNYIHHVSLVHVSYVLLIYILLSML